MLAYTLTVDQHFCIIAYIIIHIVFGALYHYRTLSFARKAPVEYALIQDWQLAGLFVGSVTWMLPLHILALLIWFICVISWICCNIVGCILLFLATGKFKFQSLPEWFSLKSTTSPEDRCKRLATFHPVWIFWCIYTHALIILWQTADLPKEVGSMALVFLTLGAFISLVATTNESEEKK